MYLGKSLNAFAKRVRWTTIVMAMALCMSLPSILSKPMLAQGGNGAGAVSPNANAAVDAKVTNAAAGDTFLEVVFSGGVMGIGIMIVLILLSIIAFYLVIDQAMTLRKKELVPAELAESVRQFLAQGKLHEADQACREKPCPLSFVLVSGIAEIEYGWSAVEKALEDSTAEQAARLYRKLEYLSVIGNIAPMIGLLGTVTGMILAFREVAMSQGTAGAGDLAGGIYSALVTTVCGLVIAIPSLGAFAIFRNKIDEVISDTAYSAQLVFGSVRRRLPGGTASRTAVAPPPRG